MLILNGQWTAYIHIFPNNKYYVGITSRKPEDRWGKQGIRYKNQRVYTAIQKYGWDNIEHFIFAKNLTKKEANNIEKLLIKKLDSVKNGYNDNFGGIGNLKFSDNDHKQIFNLWQQGLIITEIAKQFNADGSTITNILKAQGVPEKDLLLRANQKEKLFKKEIFNNFNQKKSLKEIGKILNIDVHTVSNILQKQNVSHKEIYRNLSPLPISEKEKIKKMLLEGKTRQELSQLYNCHPDTISNFVKDFLPEIIPNITKNFHKSQEKQIAQYDINNNLIQIFSSIKEAAIAINKPEGRSHISDVCRGKRKIAYGFQWKYFNGSDTQC